MTTAVPPEKGDNTPGSMSQDAAGRAAKMLASGGGSTPKVSPDSAQPHVEDNSDELSIGLRVSAWFKQANASFDARLPKQAELLKGRLWLIALAAMLIFSICCLTITIPLALDPGAPEVSTNIIPDNEVLIPLNNEGLVTESVVVDLVLTPIATPTPLPEDWWELAPDTVVFNANKWLIKPPSIGEWQTKFPWGLVAWMLIGPWLLRANMAKDRAAALQKSDIGLVNYSLIAVLTGMLISEAITWLAQLTGWNPGEAPFYSVLLGLVLGLGIGWSASKSGTFDYTPIATTLFVAGIWFSGWYGENQIWAVVGFLMMLGGLVATLVEVNRLTKTQPAILVAIINAAFFYVALLVVVIAGLAVTTMPVSENEMIRLAQVVMLRLINGGGPLISVLIAAFLMDAFGDKVASIIKDTIAKVSQADGVTSEITQTARFDAQNLAWMVVYLTILHVVNAVALLVAM